MKTIIYDRDGLKIKEQIPSSLHWIENITKDDLIECLINGETSAYSDYRPDANILKSLIGNIDNLEQFVSNEIAHGVKIHFVDKNFVSRFNIKLNNDCKNLSDFIRKGRFSVSDLITARLISIDELMAIIRLPIDPYSDFVKGEPIFDYPINNNLYYIGNNSIFCFPFTKILKKRIEEQKLMSCYLGEIDYEIKPDLKCIEFVFYSEENTGRHWYTTTEYIGKINLKDLSVEIKAGKSSDYKF